MRRLAACAILAAFAPLALAQLDPKTLQPGPETRWFNLDRTTTGYVAAGNLAGTFWAFHLRGQEMKRLADTTFSLDAAVIQVRAVPRGVVKGGRAMGLLAAHKAYEQEHVATVAKGATFRDHDYCRAAKVPYQQWISQAPGGIAQAYVTFQVGEYVLMVTSPFENALREQAVARALGEVCASFRLQKNG